MLTCERIGYLFAVMLTSFDEFAWIIQGRTKNFPAAIPKQLGFTIKRLYTRHPYFHVLIFLFRES